MERIENFSDLEEIKFLNNNNFGFNYLFKYEANFDEEKVKNQIWSFYEKIYDQERKERSSIIPQFSKKPEVIFLNSPMACQIAALAFNNFEFEIKRNGYGRNTIVGPKKSTWETLEILFVPNWLKSFEKSLQRYLSYGIWKEVWPKVRSAIKNYLDKKHFLPNSPWTIEISDLVVGWEKKPVLYNNEFISSGVFELILLENYCIVSELPFNISKNKEGDLHSQNDFAVKWRDGFGMCYWNGVKIPSEWIKLKESITRETIFFERNIERRRCLMEIIGNEKYLELLNVICINTVRDDCGNPMKLFRTKERDSSINEYLYYLKVVDPSTKREYYISVPPTYDVHWAKSVTFNHEKIIFRQGDVGLLDLETPYEKPIIES